MPVLIDVVEDGVTETGFDTVEYKTALFQAIEDGDPNGSPFGKMVHFYIPKSSAFGMQHVNRAHEYKDRVKRINNNACFNATGLPLRVVKDIAVRANQELPIIIEMLHAIQKNNLSSTTVDKIE